MNRMQLWFLLLSIALLVPLVTIPPATATIKPTAATPETAPTPEPVPTPRPQAGAPAAAGGFLTVEGSRLMRLGEPVIIKGINYYPSGRPWAEMWDHWDAPQMQRELTLARDLLGINAVRVLLPLRVPRDAAIQRLSEFVQIAGDLDMRVIVTLFDFHNGFPQPGTPEEARHFDYLNDIIGNFIGDDRIFAWDLHNEPDHYPAWQEEGKAPEVLTWLGRMADHVHWLAPNHLVTVGMGQYDNLWQPGPDGRRVIDYSDVISIHIYNAADAERQLYELGLYTDKPILIEEFGWPTGPRCVVDVYDEATQEWVYTTVLQAAQQNPQVAGVVAWTLRDYHPGPTRRWDTREEHYGLFRPDDSLKPAAERLRDYPASPLPATFDTDLPLTREGINAPGGIFAPVYIPEAGYYVKGWFRRTWDLLSGMGTFGKPLGEAFIRPEDGVVVQYFEAAVLEFRPENTGGDSFYDITAEERAMRLIQPANIGLAYTAGREFPRRDDIPSGGRRFQETGYTLHGDFLEFYEGLHGEWRLGAPISEAFVEEINGTPTRVQYFQRGRLEVNLDGADTIRLGQLGSWAFNRQCRTTSDAAP